MLADVDPNGAEVSDAMSENENEYDDPVKDEDDDRMAENNTSPEATESATEVKKKYDPKDPHRPRRKKARRACYACQRAHLTCGDERPCGRCIKRGLADGCQDGVRKKAKYLHDAPPEALVPVLGANYNPNPAVAKSASSRHLSNASDATTYYSPQTSRGPPYSLYTGSAPNQVASLPDSVSFSNGPQQPSVATSPGFQHPAPNGRPAQMNGMPVPQTSQDMSNNFASTALFDPSNPAIFNFDLEGLNFGSHYGALEFSMLGHMSSGTAETPPRDPPGSQGADMNYGPSQMFPNGNGQYNQLYENNGLVDNFMVDGTGNGNGNNAYSQGNMQHGLPHAYAVAAAGPTPNSLASPGTDNTNSPQTASYGFDSSPKTSTNYPPSQTASQAAQRPKPKPSATFSAKLGPQSILGKRNRDPSYIYETVKEPYPYTTGFHNLIAFLQRRFSSNKTMRIAKSLAAVRPSFISCMRHLNRQDLVFMEKCLQRTLFEYEDFMGHCAAPTIVCRRTGEVATVNKEFVALTSWTKDVLLGKAANLNVNTGNISSVGGAPPLPGKPEINTPRLKTAQPEGNQQSANGKANAVFIAELMDEDSVIQFYEDFAQLAFGDSRGSVTRKCRLLKYRTEEMKERIANEQRAPQKDSRGSILSNRVTKIDGEHGISKLEKDGKLDCRCCWTIKRDPFDIPMLIIINFLPWYDSDQEHVAL